VKGETGTGERGASEEGNEVVLGVGIHGRTWGNTTYEEATNLGV
jgi:hypothetical protein